MFTLVRVGLKGTPILSIQARLEHILDDLQDELGEHNMEANGDSPRIDHQAKLSNLPKPPPIGLLAHLTIRVHLELDDQSGDEIHPNVGEESHKQYIDEEGEDADAVYAVGEVKHA